MLDEDDRVVVADRRLQQALAVGRGGGAGDEQSRHLQVERLEAVGVGGAELVAAAARHPDHHWHLRLAVEHVWDRGGVVDDLVQREEAEVDGHQLDDRPQAVHRRPDAGADDRVLGDRGVADAPLAELLQQAFGHLEGAFEDADVLAHHEDGLVGAHLLEHRVAQRFPHPQLRHQSLSSSPGATSPSGASTCSSSPSWTSPCAAGFGRGPSACPA